MGRRSDTYQAGVPTKPYDLLREGLLVAAMVLVLVVVLAAVFSSPDYPTVTGQNVASRQPIAFVQTTTTILAGQSSIQDYGPPYNAGDGQTLLGVDPAKIVGVHIPLNPATQFVLQPLQRLATVNPAIQAPLAAFEAASTAQQQKWLSAYLAALNKATVSGDTVNVPAGNYGPVPTLMNGMLALGRAGLLEGALLASSPYYPYALNFTQPLLYFQDDVYANVATTLNMTGSQWGVSNETGNYPGAWWTWPYTFLYQIPPMSHSGNADLQAMAIITIVFLLLILLPFIPGLNRLPRYLGVYRLIWRDWYRRQRA
jgi:hypothetical protein